MPHPIEIQLGVLDIPNPYVDLGRSRLSSEHSLVFVIISAFGHAYQPDHPDPEAILQKFQVFNATQQKRLETFATLESEGVSSGDHLVVTSASNDDTLKYISSPAPAGTFEDAIEDILRGR